MSLATFVRWKEYVKDRWTRADLRDGPSGTDDLRVEQVTTVRALHVHPCSRTGVGERLGV